MFDAITAVAGGEEVEVLGDFSYGLGSFDNLCMACQRDTPFNPSNFTCHRKYIMHLSGLKGEVMTGIKG